MVYFHEKNLREKALEEIEKVRWIIENSKNRITPMVWIDPTGVFKA